MRLVEIAIEDQKEAILKRIGKEVIINDDHRPWRHGIIQGDPQFDVYQLALTSEEYILRLHYHDLKNLLEVYPQ